MPAYAARNTRHRIIALWVAVLFSMSASAQADDTSTCKLRAVGKLALSFAGIGLNPVIPATINGNPTLAMISTSTGAISLGKGALDKMGITTQRTNQRQYVAGGGIVRVYSANVDELKIGPMTGSGEYEVSEMQSRFGAILGTNSLLKFDLEVALAAKYLRFFEPEKCNGVSLAYWEGGAGAIPFTVTNRDFSPNFTVKINGKEMPAELSLSAEHSMLDLHSAKAAGMSPEMPGAVKETRVIMGAGNTEVWTMPIDSIEIGDERINKVRIMVTDLSSVEGHVILGMDFVRAHRILLSMSQKQMYFSYLGGPVFTTVGSVKKNPWYRADAEQGNPDAQFRMGDLLDRADGQSVDASEAIAWYEKAAAQGHPDAKRRLAMEHFMHGDYKESARLYREAADSNEKHLAKNEFLYLSEARLGNTAAAARSLKEADDAHPLPGWSRTVIQFHRGEIDGVKLMAAADASGTGVRNSRRCDAFIQIGESHLVRKQAEPAKAAFASAIDGCEKNMMFHRLALAELARLNGGPAQ